MSEEELKISKLEDAILDAARTYMVKHNVYTLEDNDLPNIARKAALKIIEMEKDEDN